MKPNANAIVLEAPGKFQAMPAPSPEPPKAGFALVQIHRVGVCGTDLHAFAGKQPFFSYPRILGHELGVEIAEIPPNDLGLKPGDLCAVEPYLNCGRCVACRRGKPNCCVKIQVMGVHADGGMRPYLSVPISKLHRSPGGLSLDQLALVETLGIGAHAVHRARIEPGEWALVLGTGPIGLSVIPFDQAAGAKVIAADVNPRRLDFCRRSFGVSATLDPSAPDFLDALRGLTDDELPTAVFDATGNPSSMMASFNFPAHGGRLVFVGLFLGDVTFNDPNFHRRELTLLGSRNALPEDFGRILGLLASGQVDTAPWITHRAPLDAVPDEFPRWTNPESNVLKAMIDVG